MCKNEQKQELDPEQWRAERGANRAMSPVIQAREASKEWNYKIKML